MANKGEKFPSAEGCRDSGGVVKMKKLVYLIVSLISPAVSVGGVLFLIFGRANCGATNHGGMLTYVCAKIHFWPTGIGLMMIVAGIIGSVTAICLLIKLLRTSPINE